MSDHCNEKMSLIIDICVYMIYGLFNIILTQYPGHCFYSNVWAVCLLGYGCLLLQSNHTLFIFTLYFLKTTVYNKCCIF